MSLHRLPAMPIAVWILAVCLAVLLEVSQASAQQAAMQRSAGQLNRGETARRSGGLAAQTRGRSVTLPSERRKSQGTSEFDSKLDKDEARSTYAGSSEHSDASSEDEDAEPDYGARTLGQACMYGPRGEVIFRPAGAVCRGEVVPPLPSPPAASSGTAPAAPRSPRTAPLDAGAPQPARRAPREMSSRPRERRRPASRAPAPRPPRRPGAGISEDCIIGPDGRVLYTPPGLVCPR